MRYRREGHYVSDVMYLKEGTIVAHSYWAPNGEVYVIFLVPDEGEKAP